MYHIRRADSHEERSLHIENTLGFKRAVSEAYLRTHHTGVPHEIVDDNGKHVYTTEAQLLEDLGHLEDNEAPVPVLKSTAPPVPWMTILKWALIGAPLIWILFGRR